VPVEKQPEGGVVYVTKGGAESSPDVVWCYDMCHSQEHTGEEGVIA